LGRTATSRRKPPTRLCSKLPLGKVDELIHIGRRMRAIALQSAVGGMALSMIGMGFAAAGLLPPVAGAIAQELIDVGAVLNSLRMTLPTGNLRDEGF
jgi:cation transport ATPase